MDLSVQMLQVSVTSVVLPASKLQEGKGFHFKKTTVLASSTAHGMETYCLSVVPL